MTSYLTEKERNEKDLKEEKWVSSDDARLFNVVVSEADWI